MDYLHFWKNTSEVDIIILIFQVKLGLWWADGMTWPVLQLQWSQIPDSIFLLQGLSGQLSSAEYLSVVCTWKSDVSITMHVVRIAMVEGKTPSNDELEGQCT